MNFLDLLLNSLLLRPQKRKTPRLTAAEIEKKVEEAGLDQVRVHRAVSQGSDKTSA